ncbi:MAG: helix-turn-helix transcriptional regulator [Planctomycetota bacterium]
MVTQEERPAETTRANDAVRSLSRLGISLDCRELLSTTSLTPRELELTDLIMRGLGNPEIARRLGITASTLRTHIKRIYRKSGVHSKSDLILLVIGRLADQRDPRSDGAGEGLRPPLAFDGHDQDGRAL